jgi:hypothetical protein
LAEGLLEYRGNEPQPYQSQCNGEAADDPIAADVSEKSPCDLRAQDGTDGESYSGTNAVEKQACGDMRDAAYQSG